MPSEKSLLMSWVVYLIRDKDDRLYTGITTDIERRFKAHTEGKGAKNLRGRGPLTLHCHFQAGTQQQALRIERTIKKCVITSYSIHYTKLYDSQKERNKIHFCCIWWRMSESRQLFFR